MDRKFKNMEKLREEFDNKFPFRPIINNNIQINMNFEDRQKVYAENTNKHKKE